MPPKKGKKMNLNEFLGDSTLGSWADEMDALPSAPAPRSENEPARDRFARGGRDDYLSSRPDRAGPPKEDLPLPTSPPWTAFIGNLSFTVTELEMEKHFGSDKIKTVKIIRGPDDRPKGFGYIEFTDLESLKQGIALSGTELAGRVIRVSVADPPKERSGGGGFEDSKFDSPWRRDGPLPPLQGRGGSDLPRRRNDSNASDRPSSISESSSNWRDSARARPPPPPESDPSQPRKREIGFGGSSAGAADREDVWVRGANFKPSQASDEPPSRFGGGGFRSREPAKETNEEDDWRSPRTRPSISPTSSNPPTPQMGRRKLDLLPRSNSGSASTSPLSSPKLAPAQPVVRSNPFGDAKPVDVSSREKAVSERLEKDRASHPMSRNTSRQGTERSPLARAPSSGGSERPAAPAAERPKVSTAPNVSPAISFANMAARKDAAGKEE